MLDSGDVCRLSQGDKKHSRHLAWRDDSRLRTRTFPMVAFPTWLSFLPGYNALTYRLAEQIVWSGFRRATNRWRSEVLGLAARPFLGDFGRLSQLPTLLGFSEAVVPRPPDWGDNVYYTGYWRPEEPAWTPPLGLTVSKHISNIFNKVQVAARAQAIVQAREAGLGRNDPLS